jgi:hypothetical protein
MRTIIQLNQHLHHFPTLMQSLSVQEPIISPGYQEFFSSYLMQKETLEKALAHVVDHTFILSSEMQTSSESSVDAWSEEACCNYGQLGWAFRQ